ncbi:MAG: DUF5915 domain-containing protein, partial [Planctomycetota bacterium]
LSLTPASLASASSYRPIDQRGEIDQWIFSELHRTVQTVTERMDALDNFGACKAITDLVDGLSNWYVRRSRDRFWASEKQSADKLDAYWTLYEVLIEVTKLVAPFVPFLSETLWKNLTRCFEDRVNDSVHLCDYPESDSSRIDNRLSASMNLLREIASLGRAARAEAKLKVRLPLSRVEVVLVSDEYQEWLGKHDALVREELNVKAVDYTTDGQQYVQYQVVPNFKRLGPKVGKQIPALKKALLEADGNAILQAMNADGEVSIELPDGNVTLDGEDIEVRLQAREGWSAAQGSGCVVVLSTEVTDELRREGHAKDLIRTIQNARKSIQCDYQDRIKVGVVTESDDVLQAIKEHGELIRGETLTDDLELNAIEAVEGIETDLGTVFVSRIKPAI